MVVNTIMRYWEIIQEAPGGQPIPPQGVGKSPLPMPQPPKQKKTMGSGIPHKPTKGPVTFKL